VRSDHIQNSAVGTHIGAQETNHLTKDWHPEFQDSGNEVSLYIVLLAGHQFGIWRGARSVQMRMVLLSKIKTLKNHTGVKGMIRKIY
jgi:hypothetical protein